MSNPFPQAMIRLDRNDPPPWHLVFPEDRFKIPFPQTVTRSLTTSRPRSQHWLHKAWIHVRSGRQGEENFPGPGWGQPGGHASPRVLAFHPQPHPQLLESGNRWQYFQKHLLSCQSPTKQRLKVKATAEKQPNVSLIETCMWPYTHTLFWFL